MVDELRHSYAQVDGVRIHWAERGTPSSQTPLVLLHGLTDSYLTWRPVVEPLARDRLVLMPDLPGCGLSERPDASYSLEWQAQMIAHWLVLLDLRSVDVIGHSYGGGVAQMLLLACPERIRRIVLVAAGGLGRGVGFWLKLATFPKAVEHWGQPFMAFGTRHSQGHAREDAAKHDVAVLSAMNAERGTARAFSRMVRDVIDWRGQTRLFLQRAHEVTSFPPMAVFWGERDALIPMSHGRDFVDVMEGAVFRSFPNAGHYLHHECPEEFVNAALAFLNDSAATPARLRADAVAPLEPKKAFRSVLRSLRGRRRIQKERRDGVVSTRARLRQLLQSRM